MNPRRLRFPLFLGLGGLGAVFALGACSRRGSDAEVNEEIVRRERFARSILVVDGGPAPAFRVGSSTEVHFEEGFTPVQFDPMEDAHAHAFRWMGQRGHVRLRTHDNAPMHLRIAGWMNEKVLHLHPTVMAFIDGLKVADPVDTDEKGIFVIDAKVDPETFRGKPWVDLDIVPSSVAFHWSDPPELRIAVIFDFAWRRETP
jgi:hypothetical protein